MLKKILCLALCLMMALASVALAYDGTAPVTEETKTFSILTTNGASLWYDWDNMVWWQKVLEDANIKLEMELVDSSAYGDVARPRLAAGVDLPDIIQLPSADNDMSYANSGIFLDLAEYFDTLGFNLKQRMEAFPTLKGSLTTPDGGMYYVPALMPADANMRTVMVNRRYLEQLGMKPEDITTLDEFTEYARKVKEGDFNGNGDATDEVPIFIRSGMIGLFRMYFGIEGEGWYQVEDGTVVCTAIDDRYKEFLTWAHDAYADGLIYNEFASANYDTQTALFSADQVGSIIHFISNCTGYSQTVDPEWKFNVDDPIIVPLAISGPNTEDKVCWGRAFYGGGGWGITTYCEDPETAFAFMDYLHSWDVAVQTWYGTEGVDYELVDGEFKFNDVYYDNKDNYLTKMGYNCSALPYSYHLYGSKQCTQVFAAIEDFSQYVVNPTIGYSYKNDDENEIINAYSADLNTYFSEQQTAFIMGTRSLDEWDDYVATVKSMGVDEMIAVNQAAVDRAAE